MNFLKSLLPDFWPDRVLNLWYEDFVGVFLTGFIVTLLLPLIVAGCASVVLLGRPTAFGFANLFRPSTAKGRLLAGLGVGALLWQTLLAGYLFEPLATNFTQDRSPFCDVQPSVDPDGKTYTTRLFDGLNDRPPDDPRRDLYRWNPDLRYTPASVFTVFRYGVALLVGGIIGVPLILAGSGFVLAVFAALARVWAAVAEPKRARRPAAPVNPPSPPLQAVTPPSPTPRLPLARRLLLAAALPAGVVVGFLAAVSVPSMCWHLAAPQQVSDHWGRYFVYQAGWGKADARVEFVKRKRTDGLNPDERTDPATGRERTASDFYEKYFDDDEHGDAIPTVNRLRPYFAVFGAFFVTAALIFVAYVSFYFFGSAGDTITPASGILFLLQLLLAGHIFMTYFAATPHLSNLALLFLVLASAVRYKLRFRGLAVPGAESPDRFDLYDQPVRLTAYPSPAVESPVLLKTRDVAFRAKQLPAPVGELPKRPMALVCVSGGGSRAAAWTMKVLTTLEDAFAAKGIAFPYDIRLVSGASGGMIAGAYYVAGLAEPDRAAQPDATGRVPIPRVDALRVAALRAAVGAAEEKARTPAERAAAAAARSAVEHIRTDAGRQAFEEGVAAAVLKLVPTDTPERPMLDLLNDSIRGDFLTPIARKMAFWDVLSLVVPAVVRADRGNALEDAWRTALQGVMGTPFATLQPGEKAGWRPSLVFTPMTVEDGRQLFISNLDLRDVATNKANVLRGRGPGEPAADPDLLSREGWGFFRLFPKSHDSFAVGTAARMSATFPYVLPAVELPTDPPLRVVDAGYYDNYGVGVAAEWLHANLDWVRANCSGVVIVQIRDGLSEEGRRDQTKGMAEQPGPGRFRRGVHWLTTPVEGLYSFRAQATAYRNDNLLMTLTETFRREHFAHDFFQTVAFELASGDDVSLNFTLTQEEKDRIDRDATRPVITGRVQALLDWWTPRLPAASTPKSSGPA